MPRPDADAIAAALRTLARAAKRLGRSPNDAGRIAAVQAAFFEAQSLVERAAYRHAVDANSAASQRRIRAIQAALEECPIQPDDARYVGWVQCTKFIAEKLCVRWPPYPDSRPAPPLTASDESTQGRA